MTKIITLLYLNANKLFLIISGYTLMEVAAMVTLTSDITNLFKGTLQTYVLAVTALWYIFKLVKDSFEWWHGKKMRKKELYNLELEETIKKMRIERRRNEIEYEILLKNDHITNENKPDEKCT